MNITRTSAFTGIRRTVDLPVTEGQMQAYLEGALLQHAFPNLSPAEREFIKTGVTEQEWNSVMGPEPE